MCLLSYKTILPSYCCPAKNKSNHILSPQGWNAITNQGVFLAVLIMSGSFQFTFSKLHMLFGQPPEFISKIQHIAFIQRKRALINQPNLLKKTACEDGNYLQDVHTQERRLIKQGDIEVKGRKTKRFSYSLLKSAMSLLGGKAVSPLLPPQSTMLKRRDLGGEQSAASDEDILSEGE